MRITQVSVTKLFGIFDHTIPLNLGDRITIIHGPNGFGKTVLLRMLNELFNSRYSELRSIPFKELRVEFEDNSNIRVSKTIEKESEIDSKSHLKLYFYKPDSKPETFSPKYLGRPNEMGFSLGIIEDIVPELDRIGSTTWLYLPTKEELSLEDVLDRFGELLPGKLTRVKEPKWLSELKSSMNVRFIKAQRLLNISNVRRSRVHMISHSMVPSVATYSEELAENIQATLAEYGALSQSLDRTFPVRVVNQKNPSDLTKNKLRNKLNDLEEKRSRLIEAGLLDKDENADFQVQQEIDDRTKSILSVYVEDVEKKLSVFTEIADKIYLLKNIIDERFKYKKMTVSKENGFTFTTSDGHPLSPTDLSSGEQHELVLFYELLFKVQPNSFILIDEPELSLHVAWQVKFLDDLQQIIKLAGFDVLIATHSPDIINDRWDLTVKLEGPTE